MPAEAYGFPGRGRHDHFPARGFRGHPWEARNLGASFQSQVLSCSLLSCTRLTCEEGRGGRRGGAGCWSELEEEEEEEEEYEEEDDHFPARGFRGHPWEARYFGA